MADVPGDGIDGGLILDNAGGRRFSNKPGGGALLSDGGGGAPVPTFKMRGRDDGRAIGSDYIVWLFTGANPDFAGTGFAGGTPTPIGSLIAGSVVVAT